MWIVFDFVARFAIARIAGEGYFLCCALQEVFTGYDTANASALPLKVVTESGPWTRRS